MNSNKKVHPRAKRVLLGLGSVSLCLSVLLTLQAIKSWQDYEKNGSKVEGVVTFAVDGGENMPSEARYKFNVEGREYSGSSKHYIPKGKRVLVSYLLSDPSENQVQDFMWYIDSSFYIFMSFGVGAVLFALVFSKSTSTFMSRLEFSLNKQK